ncbi:interleukin-21 receptor-like [Solea senegalensis]|uniref:Interleukin-21 receptor-like n=1 Tax=Solea senegalensis TaxID=28829 RepID=A0AAV6RU95_SOLSE|nr:interleukin-21 receptor [Solea senegalensis]KAG7507825.1 interleukin-21 receptor-like [Solea senegalensis]
MFHRSSARPCLKLLLLLLLLMSAKVFCLHGNLTTGDRNLQCVNDYLFTINCTVSITPSENSSSSVYWLTITETHENDTFVCPLTNTDGRHFCSVETSDDEDSSVIFSDTDVYRISLYHNQTDGDLTCELLDGAYRPFTHIKPNAPCCLSVGHNASQRHFTWSSTYEEHEHDTALVDSFQYQLHFFTTRDHSSNSRMISHTIETDRTNYRVDDGEFAPDTEYTARVRSSPNMAFFKGQWSDWSSKVHFKTESTVTHLSSNISELKVFVPLCVLAIVILLLCYVPVKKWKQSASIPTPAPYFHTLYSDCQGDFKRWVRTQERTVDTQKAEASLRIDGLIKCTDIPGEDRQPRFHLPLVDDRAYNNLSDPVSDESLLDLLYAVATMNPPSAPEDLTLSSDPGSSDERDSGCVLYSDMSLGKGSPWYCNEYCTPSDFTQLGALTAEHQRALQTNPCLQKMIRVDAVEEAVVCTSTDEGGNMYAV